MSKRRDPESLLPLTPGMFQVLIALADGEKHGYAIIKEVARRTGGEIALERRHALHDHPPLRSRKGSSPRAPTRPDAALDDERRRYYRLTDFGRDVARAEARAHGDRARHGAREEPHPARRGWREAPSAGSAGCCASCRSTSGPTTAREMEQVFRDQQRDAAARGRLGVRRVWIGDRRAPCSRSARASTRRSSAQDVRYALRGMRAQSRRSPRSRS